MNPTLSGRRAIVHGGAGAIGSAVARALARDGADVFLTGRTRARLDTVASDIRAAGGRAETAQLDALDGAAMRRHADDVAARAGGIDILINAVGFAHVQGPRLAELTVEDFALPIERYTRFHFHAVQAAQRHLAPGGAVIMFSAPGARLAGAGWLGSGTACAAVECMARLFAAELGDRGVRVVCVRPDAIPEAVAHGSHTGAAFAGIARAAGTTVDEMLAARARTATLLGRLPSLADVAETVAFLASPRAAAITGTIANLTAGSLVD
jgi:3-oxoacyl-[acyl-carrier protein] reductase